MVERPPVLTFAPASVIWFVVFLFGFIPDWRVAEPLTTDFERVGNASDIDGKRFAGHRVVSGITIGSVTGARFVSQISSAGKPGGFGLREWRGPLPPLPPLTSPSLIGLIRAGAPDKK